MLKIVDFNEIFKHFSKEIIIAVATYCKVFFQKLNIFSTIVIYENFFDLIILLNSRLSGGTSVSYP